jgi:hypothetical protein
MFEKLFNSKTRIKLLKLFLLHADEHYGLISIAKNLKLSVTQVKSDLDNLEKIGIILTGLEADANEAEALPESNKPLVEQAVTPKKYYQTNVNFILFEELKALILKEQTLYERDFIDKLTSVGKVKLLILTGFFVNYNESPVDLLIVGNLNKHKLLKTIKELEKELGKEINFSTFETGEYLYRRNVTDVFLYGILEGKKIVVIDELNY